MPKKKAGTYPTEAEIMSCRNLPVSVVADYLGCLQGTLRDSLRQKSPPFGYGSQNRETGTCFFHISPGLLVAYQNGQLQSWDTKQLIERIADEVEKVVELRYKASIKDCVQRCCRHVGDATIIQPPNGW